MSLLNKIAGAGIVILLLLISLYHVRLTTVAKDRDIYKNNQAALLGEISDREIGMSVVSGKLALSRLEVEELLQSDISLKKELEKNNIKIKRLQNIIDSKVTVSIPISTAFRDSVINVTDTIRCLQVRNENVIIDICDNITAKNLIIVPVELKQVIHKVPKEFKFWFIRIKYGTKGAEQYMYTTNPYVVIDYSRFIEMK